jgi:hypothetical protein
MNRNEWPQSGYDRSAMVKAARYLLQTILAVTRSIATLASSAMRSRTQLAAENLFLREQLALYQERKVKACRADDATRVILAGLSAYCSISRPTSFRPGHEISSSS